MFYYSSVILSLSFGDSRFELHSTFIFVRGEARWSSYANPFLGGGGPVGSWMKTSQQLLPQMLNARLI